MLLYASICYYRSGAQILTPGDGIRQHHAARIHLLRLQVLEVAPVLDVDGDREMILRSTGPCKHCTPIT